MLGFAPDARAQFWKFSDAPCRGAGARPGSPGKCRASITFSPFHLGYPIVLVSTELRIFDKLGVSADNAIGAFNGGSVGQFGLRLPFYPLGSFDGGLQLGPFGRATNFALPDESTLLPAEAGSLHSALAPLYNDVEFARANGRDALYFGVLIGGKFVVGHHGAASTWLRGFTIQGGFLAGYHHLRRHSRHAAHPLASRTGDGFLPQLYLDLGWSF